MFQILCTLLSVSPPDNLPFFVAEYRSILLMKTRGGGDLYWINTLSGE